MSLIAAKAPKEQKAVSASEKQEDYYKGFRSAVVLAWMFSNLALSSVVLNTAGLERENIKIANDDTSRSQVYMEVVLWSVAGLSLFRFCGAMWFLVVRLVSFGSLSLPDVYMFLRDGLFSRLRLRFFTLSLLMWMRCADGVVPLIVSGRVTLAIFSRSYMFREV